MQPSKEKEYKIPRTGKKNKKNKKMIMTTNPEIPEIFFGLYNY